MSGLIRFIYFLIFPLLLTFLFSVGGIHAQICTKLNPQFPDDESRDVSSFQISLNGDRVVYRADQDTDEVIELYSVPIGGGEAVKLNDTLTGGGAVISFLISPNGDRVVYRADQREDNVFELYSVLIEEGGEAVELSGTLTGGEDVSEGFQISPNGDRVVYRADQDTNNVIELYSVPIEGGAVVRLNGTLTPFGSVDSFRISPDGTRFVYRADQDTIDVFELYSVPIEGGVNPVKLNSLLTENGDVSSFQISPNDGRRVVYRADQETDNQFELYSVPIEGGSAVKLNDMFTEGGDVTNRFQISPNAGVVYRGDRETNNQFELYSCPLLLDDGEDDCLSNPCENGGVCTDLGDSFSCKCEGTGFECTECENDIDECSGVNNCDTNAVCINTIGSFTCRCNPGFSGDGEECEPEIVVGDIDACISNPCDINATCTDLPDPAPDGPTGRRCDCNAGFAAEAVIDENSENLADNEFVEIICLELICDPLSAPENGTIEPPGAIEENGGGFEGFGVFYLCEDGFELVGASEEGPDRVCQADSTWSNEPPTCEPICPDLPNPENGSVIIPGNRGVGSRAIYSCNQGFELNGVRIRRCQDDGTWSPEPPTCLFIITAEICDDGIDNDQDNTTDCFDTYCCGNPACENVVGADCGVPPVPFPSEDQISCNDGVDNDGDGFTDCMDTDCVNDPSCTTVPPPPTPGDDDDDDTMPPPVGDDDDDDTTPPPPPVGDDDDEDTPPPPVEEGDDGESGCNTIVGKSPTTMDFAGAFLPFMLIPLAVYYRRRKRA